MMLNFFSCAYWPFVYFLWRNLYPGPFPSFALGCLLVVELWEFLCIFWMVDPYQYMLSCLLLFCDLVDHSPPNSCLWNFPGKNPGVGCHFLLWGILLTQWSNPHLLCLRHSRSWAIWEAPYQYVWPANPFFHSLGSLFYFLDNALWSTEVLNFDEVGFISVFFCCLWFWYRICESIAKSTGVKIYTVFSSRSFIVFVLICRRWFILSECLYMVWDRACFLYVEI